MPKRIQLSRRKGWRKPEGCIVVSRPSKWGNPYKITNGMSAQVVIQWYRADLWQTDKINMRNEIRRELGGHDLACWCPLDQPCHADVLLEIANSPMEPEASHDKN